MCGLGEQLEVKMVLTPDQVEGHAAGSWSAPPPSHGFDWPRIAARVDRRLTALGVNQPGQCAFAALVGIAEMAGATDLGCALYLQAGTVAMRRITEETAQATGQQAVENFGFQWSPDDALSAAFMASGGMPEYHAWIGLTTPDHPAGVLVDFAAWHAPYITRTSKLTWDVAEPTFPVVLPVEECDRRTPGGGIHTAYYEPNLEATLLMMAVAVDRLARKAHALGGPNHPDLVDLWQYLGRQPTRRDIETVVTLPPLRPLDILRSVRRHLKTQESANA